ncbi:class I SAM-dependent methyltransferase [Chloroflexota bacterium]
MENESKIWDQYWHRSNLWLFISKYTPTYRKILRLFEHITLPKDAKILDVGCGSGKLTQLWHGKGYYVLGLDVSDESLKFTDSRGIRVVKADVRNLPFKDGAFDLVYSDGLLEHFPDPAPILAELFRVSKRYTFTLVPRTTLLNKALVVIFRIPKQYDRESHEWLELHRQLGAEPIEHDNAFTMFAITCEKGT